jgi:hypothetical protein
MKRLAVSRTSLYTEPAVLDPRGDLTSEDLGLSGTRIVEDAN